MKTIIFLAIAIFITVVQLPAQTIYAGLGSTQEDVGRVVLLDGIGNSYYAGRFRGTVDFDPGPSTYNLTAQAMDIFILKLGPTGNLIWALRLGGTLDDEAWTMAFDPSGNILVVGNFLSNMDFDPGVGTFMMSSAGQSDVFFLKLDPNGNFLWARRMGGSQNDWGFGVTTDAAGNIYTTGVFRSTADLDPHPSTTLNFTAAGNSDIFVQKLNPNGDLIWVKRIGGSGADSGYAIAVDPSGNVLVTGVFANVVDFDPGPGSYNITGSGYDGFVLKLDGMGNFVWTRQIGGISGLTSEGGSTIATDASGNVLSGGAFGGTFDFDPGPGTSIWTSAGDRDMYFQKLDPAGNLIWAKAMGGTLNDGINVVKLDPSGNVYFGAGFSGTVDFDPAPNSTYILSSQGGYDIAVGKLDAIGNLLWVHGMGGTGDEGALGLDIGSAGSLSVTGSFQGTADFDPGPGTSYLVSAGDDDIFVQIVPQCTMPTTSTLNQSACAAISLNNHTYSTSGTYTQVLTNAASCDSTITLNLTIGNATSSTLTVTACSSYSLNNQTYSASGTYLQTIPNSMGCDSNITLNLIVNSTSASTLNASSCGAYSLNNQIYSSSGTYTQTLTNAMGCDSILTLNLVVYSATSSVINATTCGPYSLNNQTYSSSGTYTQTLTNAVGCDSILTLNLMVNPPLNFSLGADTAFCPDTTLVLIAPNAADYLWSTGSTGQNLSLSTAGTYWLQATDSNGCTGSDTITVTVSTDCVWPGDANHDGIANNLDVLAIGYGFGFTGPVRSSASPSWYGQPSTDWGTFLPGMVNHKHPDCDGNGTVGFADTSLVVVNYGLTHNKTADITTGIPLMIVPEMDSFPAGDTVFFTVQWGDANSLVMDGHGLAFGIHIDAQQVAHGTLYLRYSSSFLGNGIGDLLTLTYPDTTNGDYHVALSRMDRNGRTGHGSVVRVGFLPSVVYPLTSTLGYVPIHILQPVAVDQDFNPILLTAISDSVYIYNSLNALSPSSVVRNWQIYPMPTSGEAIMELEMSTDGELEVELTNLQGQPLATILKKQSLSKGVSKSILKTEGLSEGMYLLVLKFQGQTMVKKLVVGR